MRRMTVIAFLSAVSLLAHVAPGLASLSGNPAQATRLGMALAQCGGYGSADCPGAKPDRPTEAPATPPPADKSTEGCPTKGGWGEAECPHYTIRSDNPNAGPDAGKATANPKDEPKRGCNKGGYGVTECPNEGKQAGDQPDSSSGAKSEGAKGNSSETPGSPIQQCKLGCAPQCNAIGNADLAAQCTQSCEAKCDATYGK